MKQIQGKSEKKKNPFFTNPVRKGVYFVGRKRELNRFLRSIRDSLSYDTPENLFITGEKGVGKTSFMYYLDNFNLDLGFFTIEEFPSTARKFYGAKIRAMIEQEITKYGETKKPYKEHSSEINKIYERSVSKIDSGVAYPFTEIKRDFKKIKTLIEDNGDIKNFVFFFDECNKFPNISESYASQLNNVLYSNNIYVFTTLPLVPNKLRKKHPTTRDRIADKIDLKPFSEEESRKAVNKRLKPREEEPFTEEALDKLIQASEGNPRELMLNSREAYEIYSLEDLEEIDVEVIEKVLEERKQTDVQILYNGLSEAKKKVLKQVKELEEPTTSKIAEELDRTSGTISVHLNALKEKGLLEKERKREKVLYNLSFDNDIDLGE